MNSRTAPVVPMPVLKAMSLKAIRDTQAFGTETSRVLVWYQSRADTAELLAEQIILLERQVEMLKRARKRDGN